MGKVTGGLFSLDASGSIAKTITFSKWKGRPYVRQLVKPSNPQTDAQWVTRLMMACLSKLWGLLDETQQRSWQTLADQIVASPFNAFVKANMNRWSNFQGIESNAQTPGGGGPYTLEDFAATGGVGKYTATFNITDLPNLTAVGIARGTTDGFTLQRTSFDNIIATNGVDGSYTSEEKKITPGTYFIRAIAFYADGTIGAAIADDIEVEIS